MIYGYARVSTQEQDLEVQLKQLQEAGCTVIRQEKASGTDRRGRPELKILMEFIQPGDTLVITRMDRLARSALDLLQIVKELEDTNVNLQILKQNVDTASSHGRLFVTFLAGFAEFETSLRRDRQLEGIARAKKAGKYKGRARSINRQAVFKLFDEGHTMRHISARSGVSYSSVWRLKNEWEALQGETN